MKACRIWPRNCASCKRPFIARHPRAVTCSETCSRRRRNQSDDYHRHKRHVRRAVTRITDITPQQEAAMYKRARKCTLCGAYMTSKPDRPNSKHLDHIVPLNVGGTHTHGNVRIICRTCNLARPKDGSDYTGPVTLWAQVHDVVTKPKPAPKPKLEPKVILASCGCGAQFAPRRGQTRCHACLIGIARQAAALRTEGTPWKQVAEHVGYSNVGNLCTYAKQWGGLEARRWR